MANKNQDFKTRMTVALGITLFSLTLTGPIYKGRLLSRSRRAVGKYTNWIMLFAVAGTLSAVAAIAITEAFVSATLLVLTVGEWELLAVVFYILAIILYIGENGVARRSA
jgi:hypothetical protein